MKDTEEKTVDAVFVIGTGSKNNNEELKYALRNLEKNCPFVRDVYISGECPEWVDTSVVKHLKWPDRFTHAKDANIIDKLRHACEQPGIAENILFCSDDQFQTRVCTWDDFAPRYLRQYTTTDRWYEDRKRIWHTRLRKTLDRDRARRVGARLDPSQVYYYQPHMWMQIDRDKFLEYAKWCDYEHRDDTIIASGYFNFADVGGKQNFDHIFIASNQSWPVKVTHVAYSDSSFSSAMSYLKKEFTGPSRFERTEKSVKKTVTDSSTESTPANERTDEEIIEDLKGKIKSEKVWSSLLPEVEEAEKLRLGNVVGWRKVWNDIIHRWSYATDKGKLRIPVTSEKSSEAKAICATFKEESDSQAELTEDDSGQQNDVYSKPQEKKHCSKCEERRRKAMEEAAKRASEVRSLAGDRIDDFMSPRRSYASGRLGRLGRSVPFVGRSVHSNEQTACMDCAVEHLSDAIAYMSSNAIRPDEFETELAKGEVRVAAQHLLALNRQEEYNRCIRMLDSIYSEHSLFSVSELKDLLKTVLEGRFRP